jgi:hypothetical protein
MSVGAMKDYKLRDLRVVSWCDAWYGKGQPVAQPPSHEPFWQYLDVYYEKVRLFFFFGTLQSKTKSKTRVLNFTCGSFFFTTDISSFNYGRFLRKRITKILQHGSKTAQRRKRRSEQPILKLPT